MMGQFIDGGSSDVLLLDGARWLLNPDLCDYNAHVLDPCSEVLLLTAFWLLRFQGTYWGVCSDIWNAKINNQLNNACNDVFYLSLQLTCILPTR